MHYVPLNIKTHNYLLHSMIKINELNLEELQNMKSSVAKEFIEIKNKYLQIN